MENIHNRIRQLLKEKGLSQKDFSESMGKTQSEISKWLAGGHNLTLKTIKKIESILGPLSKLDSIDVFMSEIGFSLMTGTLWRHPEMGVINIQDLTKGEIIFRIYINGKNDTKKEFRNLLDI